MLNKAILQGCLTATPELKTTQSGTSVCSFTLAVGRSYKKEGSPDTDFIRCVAWKSTAEFITRYFRKGQQMLVDGTVQVREYEQNGVKKYITEVLVLGVNFCGPKQQENQQQEQEEPAQEQQAPRYQTAPASWEEIGEEDLPF
jgi:single-strand DNA-binding protein